MILLCIIYYVIKPYSLYIGVNNSCIALPLEGSLRSTAGSRTKVRVTGAILEKNKIFKEKDAKR